MIYFNCTSVFHTFIISYIMIKEFSESNEKACLIIPGHVGNLVNLVPNLKTLPFIGDALIVEESCMDLDENSILKTIQFSNIDIVFVGGMERLGMWLFRKGKAASARVIIFEEGANIINDIDKHIEFICKFGGVKGGELLSEDIHEIWKLNGTIKNPGLKNSIRVYDLQMQRYLHDEKFIKNILKYLDIIFTSREEKKLAPIIFFDTYALAACKNCDRLTEKNILRKVVEIISEWKYEIKPHPNDFVEWKYEKNYCVSHNTNVPIEILRLKNLGLNSQGEIYIAYGITGCITNEIFLLEGEPYIIFLYKILQLYGIEYPGEALLKQLHEESSDTQKKKIFFPESLAELKVILQQITGKKVLSEENLSYLKEKELLETKREVRKMYKNFISNLPDELNETSIMHMAGDNEWRILASKKILVNQSKYRIEFVFPGISGAEKHLFRWYIARGAIVKVNLEGIHCYDQEDHLVQEISINDIICLDGEIDENNWCRFNNCDSLIEFIVSQKDYFTLQKIVIEAEIEWELSYEAMLQLKNKNLENLTHIIDRLANDNEVREQSIQQLNGYLKDWEREVHNRDEEIKLLIQQRDELNATLVKEREQWKARSLEQETQVQKMGVKSKKDDEMPIKRLGMHLLDGIFKR